MSKTYQFPLQKVLNVRAISEEALAVDLKKSKDKLAEEQNYLSDIENNKESALKDANATPNNNISLLDFQISMNYLNGLNQTMADQKSRIMESAKNVDLKRSALVTATKAKKILEKLKERHTANYLSKKKKDTLKVENEIAITAVQRRLHDEDES